MVVSSPSGHFKTNYGLKSLILNQDLHAGAQRLWTSHAVAAVGAHPDAIGDRRI